MTMGFFLVAANTTTLDPTTNLPIVECVDILADGSLIPAGSCPMYQTLGVTSIPYPPDEGSAPGYAEMAVASIGGENVIVGGRDSRTAKILGNAKPGDTILHSTGPEMASQVQLKEEKRQAVLTTLDSQGKQALVMIDGKNDKIQITAFGQMFEVSRADGLNYSSSNGANGITCNDQYCHLRGTVILGGKTPNPATASLMLGPLTGSPGGAGAVPMTAAMGVFIGQ